MATYVFQRKESFTGEIVVEMSIVHWIVISRQSGVLILTNYAVICSEVFGYFGMHSLFDDVVNLFFYFTSSKLDSDVIQRRLVRQHLKLIHGLLVVQNPLYNLKVLLSLPSPGPQLGSLLRQVPPQSFHSAYDFRASGLRLTIFVVTAPYKLEKEVYHEVLKRKNT